MIREEKKGNLLDTILFDKISQFPSRREIVSSVWTGSISDRGVLRSKLLDGRCQVQFPVALVDLAIRTFPWFSPELA